MPSSAINDGLLILLVLAFCIFISPYFSKITKIPTAPIEIMLGIGFGFLGFLKQNSFFHLMAQVGFFYLMFLAGLQIDLKRFLRMALLKLAIVYLAILYIIAILFSYFIDQPLLAIILIPLMSVGILSTLFKEYGNNEIWLNAAMLTGSLGEILSIFMLAVASEYVKFGNSLGLYLHINLLILFIAFCILAFKGLGVLFWWYPNLKILLMPYFDKDEKDVRLSMSLFFATIASMSLLGIEIAFGAFVAGIFLATFFEHKQDLNSKLGSFGFGFLVPIFFVYVGSTLDLSSVLSEKVLEYAALLFCVMTLIKVLSSIVFIKSLGYLGSLLFGLCLSMPLTLLIAVATIAKNAQIIPQNLYSAFILTSLFEVIFSMICIKIIFYFKTKLKSTI